MGNWNATFGLPYASDLEKGFIGNAEDHARTITKYYINSIKATPQPFPIPPTLPSPITLGVVVPIGPSIYINNYTTREKLFYNTIKAYYEGKEILQGKANIQDLIVSSIRLINQAKRTSGEIRSLITQADQLQREILDLPNTLLEIGKMFIELIKDKLKEIQNVRDLIIQQANNYKTTDFNPFADELALIEAITNFKPTLVLSDYRNLFVIFSDLGNRVNSLKNATSSTSNMKVYLMKRAEGALKTILDTINGFIDPAGFISLLNDIARRQQKYQRLLRGLLKFIGQSAKLTRLKKEVDRKLDIKRKQLQDVIEPKIKNITNLIKSRISENANKQKKYKQQKTYINAAKKVKEFKQTLDIKVKKKRKQIKKFTDIAQQATLILAKVDAISAGLKIEFQSIKNQVEIASNKIKDMSANVQGEYDGLAIIDFTKIKSAEELKQVVLSVVGEASELAVVLLTILQEYKVSTQDLKNIFNRVNKKYDGYTKELDRLFDIEIPYLFMLIENVNTDKVIKKPVKKEEVKVKKTSFAKILKHINSITRWIKKVKDKIEVEIKKATAFIERELESVKKQANDYLSELSKSDSAIVRVFSKTVKKTNDVLLKKNQIEKEKNTIEKIAAASDVIGGGATVLGNVSSGKYLIRDNQDALNKMLRGYSNYQKVSKKMDPQTANKERLEKSNKLKEYAQSEMLILLLVDLFKEIKNGDFVKEFETAYADIKDTLSSSAQGTVEALKNLIQNPPTLNNLSAVEQLNLAVLSNINVVNILYRLEQKYLRKFKLALKIVKDRMSKGKLKLTAFVTSFYSKVEKCPSILLMLLDYVKKGLKEIKKFIVELVKPITDHVEKQIETIKVKIQEAGAKLLEKNKEKLVNIDAKAMSLVYNIATRLFWTGATWSNTVGTSFVTTNIGPFKPIKGLPEGGAKGMADELAKSFQDQLKVMSGQVIPNPATGIPPFPFLGYN